MINWPTVTVVVLNYNGINHLEACFNSLMKLDYPTDQLTLMLVDNGSTDGSSEYVHTQFPQVKIIQLKENMGFAAGNNAGARAAQSRYIVFLNNDMWVDPQFIHGFLKAIQSDSQVVCAGAKILNWDGSRIDFGGSASDFAGHAFQVGLWEPVAEGKYNQIVESLFACGGAMMVDRQVFLDVGGFDENYFIYYEDLDLGWRLWILGHKVVFAPDAIVNHRHHGTMESVSNYRKWVLYKRNTIYTILKNYNDENFSRILSTILLSTVDGLVKRSAQNKRIPLDDFFIKSPKKPSKAPVLLDKESIGTLVAIHDVVDHLPEVMEKRRFVQEHRKRTDEQVALLFKWPFRTWPELDLRTVYPVVDAFGIQSIFKDVPRRVLIISSDILPYPGFPTVGSGLRAWGLGQGLKSRGHEVMFSMPRAALLGREAITPKEVDDLAWEAHTLPDLIRKTDVNAVVVCNWPIMDMLPVERVDVPIILDQHGPHYLEREYQHFGETEDNSRRKINALKKADFFTCAGYKQMEYFQTWLERADWTEQERRERTAVIPVSLSPDFPVHQQSDELNFVFGGMFLPWQDPSISLTALVDVMEHLNQGKLYFYGGKHPFLPVDTGIFEPLLAELRQSSHVVVEGMLSHDELIERYTRSQVAIDVMARNPERELAFTTRTVEYLWCGLPVIYHDYAELSEYIREYNAGWLVNPADRVGIETVIKEILAHPEEVATRSQNAQKLVRERLTWDRTIGPIDEFIRYPRIRRQHNPVPLSLPEIRLRIRNIPGFVINRLKLYYREGGMKAIMRAGLNFLIRRFG